MDFSLDRISDVFRRFKFSLGAKDGESVLGVDIGTSSIKIVQVKQVKGSAVLETYGEIALGPYANAEVGQSVNPPIEKISEALTDVLRESNAVSKTGGFAVPLSGALINVITLPTKDKNDLASMVPIEARKYIPVPVGEVTLDWFVIPEEEAHFLAAQNVEKNENSTDVLLVAIHNQVLEKLQAITELTSLTPQFFEVEPFSMGRASYEHTTMPTMVIDLGASSSRVYIVEFGIIDTAYTVNRGGQDLTLALAKSKGLTFTEAEAQKRDKGVAGSEAGAASLDFIFSEARRIFLSYQRKEGKPVSQIVLVGGGAALKGISEIASKYFDARVITGSPFDKLATPAFIGDVLKGAGPSFASAVGLALRALQN